MSSDFRHLKRYQQINKDGLQSTFLPSFSSPKFPQPIFLPTRKLGPTMRTPEEVEELEGREEWPLRCATLLLLAGRSPSFSLGWSMARAPQRLAAGEGPEKAVSCAHHSPSYWQRRPGTTTLMGRWQATLHVVCQHLSAPPWHLYHARCRQVSGLDIWLAQWRRSGERRHRRDSDQFVLLLALRLQQKLLYMHYMLNQANDKPSFTI